MIHGKLKTINWGQVIEIRDEQNNRIALINAHGETNKGLPSQEDTEKANALVEAYNASIVPFNIDISDMDFSKFDLKKIKDTLEASSHQFYNPSKKSLTDDDLTISHPVTRGIKKA